MTFGKSVGYIVTVTIGVYYFFKINCIKVVVKINQNFSGCLIIYSPHSLTIYYI